jgi:thiamine biosynthesis protein ThiI
MKVVCLLSGGIDSPVAAYTLARNGAEVVLLHMDNRPYSGEGLVNKVVRLTEALETALGVQLELWTAPHGISQLRISQHCQKNLQCVLCKRTMLKVARNVAMRLGADAIATGESLGQVASQTLYNINAEEKGLGFPVLRPLIGLDKLEIEHLAKKMGTYDISIEKGTPCSIVPFRPATMASSKLIAAQEEQLDLERLSKEVADEAFSLRTPSRTRT